MEVPTDEATMVNKNDISGDPKRDAFMDEGEFAEQARNYFETLKHLTFKF